MQTFLFDIFPIVIFFIVFKVWGIYVATAVAIGLAIIQAFYTWAKHRRLDRMQVTTLVLLLIFGGATLIFHNPMFIKWKVSILYWIFSVVIFGSLFIGDKPVVQRMLEQQVKLPRLIWRRVSWAWGIFFTFLGFLNLVVMLHFSTSVWVDFKLFGILGLTIIFLAVQGIYMMKHGEDDHHPHQ